MTGLLVVSGWGYPALQKKDLGFAERDLPWGWFSYGFADWLRMTDSEQEEVFQRQERWLLVGWSLGAYLLHPHLKNERVLGGVFLAAAQGFVRWEGNPHGVPKATLERLGWLLRRNPSKAMEWFYKTASHPNPTTTPPKPFAVNELLEGLAVLSSVRLEEATPPQQQKQVAVVAGKEDAILPWRACFGFSERNNYPFFLREGEGHNLLQGDAAFLNALLLSMVKKEPPGT